VIRRLWRDFWASFWASYDRAREARSEAQGPRPAAARLPDGGEAASVSHGHACAPGPQGATRTEMERATREALRRYGFGPMAGKES
jgi:hypothetical protein